MRRGLVADNLLKALNLAVMVAIIVSGTVYMFTTLNTADLQVDAISRTHGVTEGLLSAQCATASRGVFYKDALVGGDLRCIDPPQDGGVHIRAIFAPNDQYGWYVYWDGSGDLVVSADKFPRPVAPELFSAYRTFHLQAFDAATDSVEPVKVRVRTWGG